ncbi:MAG: insulinase family protein [Nitrospirota bacterium]|nr:insulinase family protein [Nitrospirota bacterium]
MFLAFFRRAVSSARVTSGLGVLLAVCLTGVAPAPALARVTTQTLDNGLTVVLIEEHKAPVISFQVWYRVGSIDEVSNYTGLSHLLEHLMFKSTGKLDTGEYARTVAARGGNENAMTSNDYTAYYMTWAPQYLPLSAQLEADRMVNLRIQDEEFSTERDVVLEERRMRIDDSPIRATVEQMYSTAFMAHPYGRPIIGWVSDLQHLKAEDARAHYRRFYAPNNAVVVVAGDFQPDQAMAEIRRNFGSLPRQPGLESRRYRTEEPPQLGERRLTLHREAQLPFVFLGYHAPNWQSPDAYALVVLSQLLFEGRRSRMYQRLVFQDRIAVDEGGAYDPLSADPELFYFYAMVAPGETPEKVEAAIYEEVARIQQTPPDAREMERARNQVEAGFILGQDSVFYQAMQYATAEVVGAGTDYVTRFTKRVGKVTAADVARVARTYLQPQNRTVATLIPLAAETPK